MFGENASLHTPHWIKEDRSGHHLVVTVVIKIVPTCVTHQQKRHGTIVFAFEDSSKSITAVPENSIHRVQCVCVCVCVQ
jgi:hypothetical protein